MVHLVLSLRKKVPSLFYSAVCLETSKRNWKLEWLKVLHSGCYTEGLYGGTAHLLGGSPLEAVPWWGNATGLGRAEGPKVGHSPDSGGSTCDNKTRRGFFVICGARPGEKVFRLVPLLQIKRNKRPLLAGIEKYKIVTTRKRQIEVGS